MRLHKSIKADSAGRINLGKECAGRLFTVSQDKDKIVLEPARIVPEREFRTLEEASTLVLSESEWSRFQKIMDANEAPTEDLRRLMNDLD